MRCGTFFAVLFSVFVTASPAVRASIQDGSESTPQSDVQLDSAATPVASVDACANIGCSGHGTCAVLDSRPTCACNDGYKADPTNGLGCLPLEPAKPAVAATPAEPAANTELAQVESVLGGIDLADHYTDYLASPQGKKSFHEYEMMRYQQKINISGAVTIFGVLAVLGSGALFALCAIEGKVWLGAAIPVAVVGVLMAVPGVIMASKNKRLLERLRLSNAPGAVALTF
jgi:hypothetical protein